MKNIIILFLFIALLAGCSFGNQVERAQDLAQVGKFEEAIKILENEYKNQPKSVPLKSLLAQTYSDYGLVLCQDNSKPPKIKYTKAKEQFAKALQLNPYLKDAQDMYDVIERIQASFKTNKIN